MEVITIDSSDDDEDNALAIVSGEEANGKDGCRQKQPIVTPKFSQSSIDDDGSNDDGGRNSCGSDSSIISSDDSNFLVKDHQFAVKDEEQVFESQKQQQVKTLYVIRFSRQGL